MAYHAGHVHASLHGHDGHAGLNEAHQGFVRLPGLQAVYRAPRTSAPHTEHRIWHYLLRGLAIERPDLVRCADITYIPVCRGFLYPVAIMDRASRHVLAWRLSNTAGYGLLLYGRAGGGPDVLYGAPAIINPSTRPWQPVHRHGLHGPLQAAGIRISIDGRGRCMDTIFVERLWRSLKYEAVYLHEIADGFTVRRVTGEWIDVYNADRPRSAPGGLNFNRITPWLCRQAVGKGGAASIFTFPEWGNATPALSRP